MWDVCSLLLLLLSIAKKSMPQTIIDTSIVGRAQSIVKKSMPQTTIKLFTSIVRRAQSSKEVYASNYYK